ncbi:MAG: glycosyltransferase family 2 protein, partial [Ruminiclostridium sp.]
MKITACSIVKNEAHNIARSIESYKGAVDEIIIVDTGSTDNTVEICKSHGATALFCEWNNDFSAAKNYALEHAKGDWIIFLDADEWFVPKLSRKTITDLLKQIDNVADGLMTTMCEYNDKTDKVYAREITTRIFRNSKQIRFKGSIHERLIDDDNEITQAHCPDIEIFHSGYANGLVEKKSKRNIDILYNAYKQGEVNTHLYFYIFRENYMLGNVEEAIYFYKLFMKQEDADKVIKNDGAIICIYEFMYRIMVQNQEKFSQKKIDSLLETAYKKYPKMPIHSYMLGCEKLKANEYCESYDWLCNAINLNSQYSEPFTNSFVAYLNDTYYKLGYISQEQGKQDQAMTYYM